MKAIQENWSHVRGKTVKDLREKFLAHEDPTLIFMNDSMLEGMSMALMEYSAWVASENRVGELCAEVKSLRDKCTKYEDTIEAIGLYVDNHGEEDPHKILNKIIKLGRL